MSEPHEELLEIADRLESLAQKADDPSITEPIEALERAANDIGRAFSGSWLGYHASVYYEDLKPPPPGAHFSQEWGLMDAFNMGSTGAWREYDNEVVKGVIYEEAGNPDLEAAKKYNSDTAAEFDQQKSEVLSILESEIENSSDGFLSRLKEQVDDLSILSAADVAQILSPSGQVMTRDATAAGQGNRLPPHKRVLSEISAIQNTFGVTKKLAATARQAGSHLKRQMRKQRHSETVGTNVFIGHGQSLIWRELKDFIEDRLYLPVDEFNRVPVAGVTNIARLSEMMDASAIAFLIMTGEDEQADGKLRARMNVVHEAGLFQGRLGFTKAIVVLEEGCETFSNIDGLGQIRFPKGKIKAAFEEIREVLEREGLIDAGQN